MTDEASSKDEVDAADRTTAESEGVDPVDAEGANEEAGQAPEDTREEAGQAPEDTGEEAGQVPEDARDAVENVRTTNGGPDETGSKSGGAGRLLREFVVIVVIALVASALLRAFVVQAYYVPSGSMLPEIHLQDRILVSRIGDVDRGEVVVFEDPGGWIPSAEQPQPPGQVRAALEWIGVLPASGHEHLVKRVVGVPGDHVVCCNDDGRLVINDQPIDESDFLYQGDKPADNVKFDVVVPADKIFVLGDHRYVSGDSSRQQGEDMFVPIDDVVGRAFAVIWPVRNMHVIDVPDVYDDVPDGQEPPAAGIINKPSGGASGDR